MKILSETLDVDLTLIKNTYDSVLVKASEYNFTTEELIITFENGALYKYFNVTSDEFMTFSTSTSIGREFAVTIKPKRFEKLN